MFSCISRSNNLFFIFVHATEFHIQLFSRDDLYDFLIFVCLPHVQVHKIYSLIYQYKLEPNCETFRCMISLYVKMKDVSFIWFPFVLLCTLACLSFHFLLLFA